MPVETIEEARTLIHNWMADRGYFIKEGDFIGYRFEFIGKFGNDTHFSIIQPESLPRAVVVVSNVSVSAAHYDALSSMELKDREEFIWDLKREFIFLPSSFTFDPSFEQLGIPKSIQFSKEISYDELTEGRLHEAVDYNSRCVLWVIWVFGKMFD
ncbi:hypothetical protein Mhar_1961 [Methanothrix harundinacea 6Ac]|uniref:DUF2299 domain-containing protein n=2 Tax=Methanothrix harundinacea TaxID=301375 RepID=G7WR14_METH6|nr:hypothetical protein Mhar_1961 [Methanothrix harundinacea 6Ac]